MFRASFRQNFGAISQRHRFLQAVAMAQQSKQSHKAAPAHKAFLFGRRFSERKVLAKRAASLAANTIAGFVRRDVLMGLARSKRSAMTILARPLDLKVKPANDQVSPH
jgi:hypothetical protein